MVEEHQGVANLHAHAEGDAVAPICAPHEVSSAKRSSVASVSSHGTPQVASKVSAVRQAPPDGHAQSREDFCEQTFGIEACGAFLRPP